MKFIIQNTKINIELITSKLRTLRTRKI